MTQATFRPALTDEDYDVCARLSSEHDPDHPITGKLLRESEVVVPEGTHRHRLLMEVDGRPAAHIRTVQMFWSDSPVAFEARCQCGKEFRDAYPAGQQKAFDLATSDGAQILSTWTDERFPERMDWLCAQGFSETQRNPVSFLDVAAFPREKWEPTVDRCLGSGFRFVPYSALIQEHGELVFERLWKLDDEIMRDVPLPYEWKGIPLEQWTKMVRTEERNWPTILVAVDGSEFVGLTMIFRNEVEPNLASTGLTGVVRTHRRRGIAAALKAFSIGEAQRMGVRRLGTDNEQDNPMFRLNVELGFRKEYDAVGFERKLA